MPRPAATGRKNQHNGRHENGLVVPGKRVSKQKSNGHLNGSPARSSSTPTPPLPSPASETTVPTTTEPQPAVNGNWVEGKVDLEGEFAGDMSTRRDRAASYDNVAAYQDASVNAAVADPVHSQQKSIKKASINSINPLAFASTILKSCPIYDTIAILIFLLQLPPMFLTLIQFLFASMTFMPPTGAPSASALNLHFDIFQGPAGTPSLGTMIAMDGFCLFVWGLFLWTWAQNFALDLAQVQVAITLGGGSAGRNGGVNVLCVFIVLILNLFRSQGVQEFLLNHVLSAKIFSANFLSLYSDFSSSTVLEDSQTSPSWIRSLLAVHILAQAGTAIARRSMASSHAATAAKLGKRVDTEASVCATDRPDSATFDSSAASISSTTAADGPMLPSTIRDGGRERVTSAKKRRRQANQVRSRQPFWAALASTKVTVMREIENSRAAHKGAALSVLNSGEGKMEDVLEELVWITQVDFSSIKFEASDFGIVDDSTGTVNYDSLSPSQLREVFFSIYLNGAQWTSVTLTKLTTDQSAGIRWRGEITGLAPNFSYNVAFVRNDLHQDVCVVNLKTPPTPDAEQGRFICSLLQAQPSLTTSSVNAALFPPAPRALLRPSSPTSTIRNSITATESKLNDLRSRLKKAKNDHRVHLSKLKKEVENYNNRLSTGGDENRLNQRSMQLERNIRSTEEAISAMETQLQELENVPEKEMKEWRSAKGAYDKQKSEVDAAKEKLSETHQAIARDVQTHQQELSSLVQRHERLKARQARQKEDHESLTNANAQGLSEKERKATERANRAKDRAKVEAGFYEQFQSIARSVSDYQMRANQTWQQVSALENAQQRQQEQMFLQQGPLTPEGILPGTGPAPISRPSAFAFGNFATFGPPGTSGVASSGIPAPASHSPDPFAAPINSTLGTTQMRARSNSVNSIYSDFSDPAFIPTLPDEQKMPIPGSAVGLDDASKMERSGSGNGAVYGNGNGVGVIGRQSASSPFAIHSHSPVSAHAVWN